jgi:hypothetical protein
VSLTLVAVAAVAAGAAWAGRAGSGAAPPPAPAPGRPVRPAAPSAGGLPPEARAALDGGNAAFRAGQFEAALGHYRAAALRAPGHAAPWYGVHMAAQKLGRPALADSAMAAIRARTGDPARWDDSAVRRAHDGARAGRSAPGAPRDRPRDP